MATNQPLIVIVGPTASGKTALAIDLARRYGGEIICADSRTIYHGMDIGTAKPTPEEQAGIPHWGLDIAIPSETYTVGEFQQYAKNKIDEIRQRGKVPLLVGGTGLYIDSVVFDYRFPPQINHEERLKLESMTQSELVKYCIKYNIKLPTDVKNKRRLIQAIATNEGVAGRLDSPRSGVAMVGIATDREVLVNRITTRTEHMFEDGVVEEAIILGKKYGWSSEAMTGNIYQSVRPLINGEISVDDAKHDFMTRDRQLAKRQMTWFRRNPYIMWCTLTEAKDYVSTRLDRL